MLKYKQDQKKTLNPKTKSNQNGLYQRGFHSATHYTH